MRILIRNGLVYDGNGNPPCKTDILIDGDMIADIRDSISCYYDYAIDADGKIVSPGFVDIHRHADSQSIIDENFGEIEIRQGISTIISGNCGLAPVPIADSSRKDVLDLISPCLGDLERCGTFRTYSEYINALEKASHNLNSGFLIGSGAIKAAVKGFSSTPFSSSEMMSAKSLIEEGFSCGAYGMSLGIMYPPECYSTEDEYKELIRVVAEHNGIICCHMRGEGDSLLASVDEIIRICASSGARLNISHLKSTGKRNWNYLIYKAVEKIDEARSDGLDVSCDFYPYDAGSTTIQSLIPPDCLKEGTEETIRYLSSEPGISKLRKSIMKKFDSWDNMVESIGWDRIILGSVSSRRELEGKSFSEAAEISGEDEALLLSELYAENEGRVGIIVRSMSEKDVDYIASLPYSSVISDALYGSGSFPHPRLYGAFPRFIRDYVIEKKTLKLEDAIYKMAGLPAKKIALKNRGTIEKGKYADINIFSLDRFSDTATYDNPKQFAKGLDWMIINGQIVIDDGKYMKNRNAGHLLKKNNNK